jgi:hypothetical protein
MSKLTIAEQPPLGHIWHERKIKRQWEGALGAR